MFRFVFFCDLYQLLKNTTTKNLKFTEFGFDATLLEGLDAMGFETATPIQEKAIPVILQKKDILACAQTGTGKTAAFLLPVLNELSVNPPAGIDTLILEPTRELVMQVDQQLEGFSYFTPVSAIPVYGGRDGQSMEEERSALKKGAPIIVATPGRLISHMTLGYVNFDNLKHLILDEADRMLDMGFAPAIMDIINRLPRNRQTLLFSATMPTEIRRFAKQLLKNPVEVSIAISKPAENILQAAYEVGDEGKVALTNMLLTGKKRLQRVLIFASTKKKVKEVAESLKVNGMNVGAMHSDLTQDERGERVRQFKNGNLPIVVATDVMSRGIDIKGIDVVINYDVPGDAEDYVHRIGRTARADASGVALTFINWEDRRKFQRIEDLMEMKVRRLPLPPDLEYAVPKPRKRSGNKSYGKKGGYSKDKRHKKRR